MSSGELPPPSRNRRAFSVRQPSREPSFDRSAHDDSVIGTTSSRQSPSSTNQSPRVISPSPSAANVSPRISESPRISPAGGRSRSRTVANVDGRPSIAGQGVHNKSQEQLLVSRRRRKKKAGTTGDSTRDSMNGIEETQLPEDDETAPLRQAASVSQDNEGYESEDWFDDSVPLRKVDVSHLTKKKKKPKRKVGIPAIRRSARDPDVETGHEREDGTSANAPDEEDEDQNSANAMDMEAARAGTGSFVIVVKPVLVDLNLDNVLDGERLVINRPPLRRWQLIREVRGNVEDGMDAGIDPTVGDRLQRPLFWYESETYEGLDAIESIPMGNSEVSVPLAMAEAADDEYTLHVDVKSVQLSQHSLFSRQLRFGIEIERLMAELNARKDSRMADYFHENIASLRQAYTQLREGIAQPGVDHVSAEERVSRLQQLRDELRRARTERDVAIGRDIAIVRRVLTLWKTIKALQKTDGFIGTTVRVKFRRVPVPEEELAIEKMDLEQQVEEAVDELFFKNAAATDQVQVDRKALRQQFAAEKFRVRLRNPQDEYVVPIVYSVSVSPPEECPPSERTRRQAMSRAKCVVKLLVNGKEAGQSRVVHLDDKGAMDVSEIFTVKIRQYPASIALRISSGEDEVVPETHMVYVGMGFDGTVQFAGGAARVRTYWGDETRVPAAPSESGQADRTHAGSASLMNELDFDPNDPRYAGVRPNSTSLFGAKGSGVVSRSADGRNASGEPKFSIAPPLSLLPYATPQEDPLEVLEAKRRAMLSEKEQDIVESEFVRNVRMHALAQKVESSAVARITEVVAEPRFPTWKGFTRWMSDVFSIRRRLRPARRKRDQAVHMPSECSVLVQVGRGTSFPMRRAAEVAAAAASRQRSTATKILADRPQVGSSSAAEDGDNDKDDPGLLHPYVEVTFQNVRSRTASAQGARPLFNETLVLPFHPPNNDFSPDVLRVVREDIVINVFDEVTSELVVDERDTDLFYERRERRYLASLRVPFATVYTNRKVEGTFRLEVPMVNIGYTLADDEPKLSVYITLEPTLELFEEEDEEPPSVEDARLSQHCHRWSHTLQNRYKDREIQCMANDLKGRSVLMCRYVRPQNPPDAVKDSVAKTIRFVSCVPFIEDAASFERRADVWLTSSQFLKIRAGDWEEHAVLLCNYLLFFKKTAYVALGRGIPEGDTAYVLLITDDKQITIINPVTGMSYKHDDAFIPLRSIGSVFNQDNVWANVQSSPFPGSMEFDFEDHKKWKPLFSEMFKRPDPLESVQASFLTYESVTSVWRDELETDIQTTLMRCIEKWRAEKGTTKWHRHASKKLSAMLEACEKDKQGIPFSIDEHTKALESLLSGYEMNGFPLCVPFTDKAGVIDAVFATDVHSQGGRETEFAVGVRAEIYPGRVAAIWIYLATLVPKR